MPDFELVSEVPARNIGWVGCSGEQLNSHSGGDFECPTIEERDRETLRPEELPGRHGTTTGKR